MNVRQILSMLPDELITLGRWVEERNYEHQLWPFTKEVQGIRYKTYNLEPPRPEPLLEAILSEAVSGDTVLDVGANVGGYSLPLAAMGCTVYSFEPNPRTFEKFEKNVAVSSNGSRIDPVNVGLSNDTDELTFYMSSQSGRSSFNAYNAEYGDEEIIGTSTVPVETLDNLVHRGRIDPPDHLKIDVEGLGLEVLEGAERTIQNHRPIIYFERHEIADGDTRDDELQALFQRLDYEVTERGYPWVCWPKASDTPDSSSP